jgi:FkbM family methyltransferase
MWTMVPMNITWKRRIADWLVSGINTCARLPGERFYSLYLADINRRFNDLGETSVGIVDDHQLRFVCPNRLTRWRAQTLATKEPETLSWIRGFAPGSVMWDVGANIGVYGLYAARACGCRVVAFEPAPANFALLAKNIQINGLQDSVTAFPIALGESTGLDLLHMQNTDPGGAFARFGGKTSATGVKLACLGFSIDRFIADFAPPFPEHIKIDVDGSEADVVCGGERTLADPRVVSILVELDDRRPQPCTISATFARLGFRLAGVHRSPLFPDSPAQNFLFVRR